VLGTLTVTGKKTGFVVDHFVNRLGETVEVGDVVIIDAAQPAYHYGVDDAIPVPEIDLARRAYDTRVCGIVCDAYGEMVDGSSRARAFSADEKSARNTSLIEPGQIGDMVTLGAFAHCKVDADIAGIQAGDLLTTSPTPGHAQKVLDRGLAVGAIIGKALASLEAGRGTIPVMVLLQ
jgi:hypothetical protein